MPLHIVHQDITTMHCEVIVDPTDPRFSARGGTDRAIHTAAGAELSAACAKLPPLHTGEVAVTEGYRLPAAHVLHTVGPVWRGGRQNEAVLLRSCYVNALLRAAQLGASSIAFPLISAGTFGFPKDRVLRIALDAISDFLTSTEADPEVYLCIYDRQAYTLKDQESLSRFLGAGRGRLIGNPFAKLHWPAGKAAPKPNRIFDFQKESAFEHSLHEEAEECDVSPMNCEPSEGSAFDRSHRARSESAVTYEACEQAEYTPEESAFDPAQEWRSLPAVPLSESASTPIAYAAQAAEPKADLSLSDWIKQQDDSFAVTLLKLIDKKHMTDVECYKKANVSKKTFWKINNDPKYRPSKPTVLAFAIALELDLQETDRLLKTVGFSLSHSNLFDMIIEFYIGHGIYDIFEINAALYQYDQLCLGC